MADNQSGHQPPPPRRRPSGRAEQTRFAFRSVDPAEKRVAVQPSEKDASRESAFEETAFPEAPFQEAGAEAFDAGAFSPRAMRPDGSPATPARRAATQRPVARRRRRTSPILVAFSLLLAAVLALLLYGYWTDPARSDVYFEGVYVGGVHLGGMTREHAAMALADKQAQLLADWSLTLRYEGTDGSGGVDRTILAEDIAMQLDLDEQVTAAWKIGREGSYAERRRTIAALRREPYHASGGVTYDEALLADALERVRVEIDCDPADASAVFAPQSEQPFQYTDEICGKRLNVEALLAQAGQHVMGLQRAEITLQPEEIAPKVTRAALQDNLTCIVVVSTDIPGSSTEGRVENIRIALGRIDGLMVDAYDRMSFNKTVGARSDPQNGYQEALEIAYGEYVTGVGGGVCQVSTTLYQAVLRAGLQVVERSAHAIPSNYADKGQDATVSDNGSDFVFRNNTDYPVFIRARLVESDDKGRRKRCEVAIYGRPLPDGIRYVLETRQVGGDIVPDPEKEYIADKQAEHVTYVDQQMEVVPRRVGYRVETYLVKLREGGMEIGRERISEDIYRPRPAQIYVGVTPRN